MKTANKTLLWTLTLLLSLSSVACNRENGPNIIHNAVKDVEGNEYDAVQIGSQIWMRTNLRTKHFRDGNEISFYNYLEFAGTNFGSTSGCSSINGVGYSPFAVVDPRGLCPKGWHVPSVEDWEVLENYVSKRSDWCYNGNPKAIAKALASPYGWDRNRSIGTPGCFPSDNNASGFCAEPISQIGVEPGYNAYFWTSTTDDSSANHVLYDCYCPPLILKCIHSSSKELKTLAFPYLVYRSYYQGFDFPPIPVRCIRDE